MAVPDEFRGHMVTVATDSLGGTSIGRVSSYAFTFETGAEPSYALGSRSPYVISEGNQRFSGALTMNFRDANEVFTLITVNPQTADTHYVRYSTGVSGDQNADITIAGIKYVSGTITASNDGGGVEETYPFEATGITLAISTV